MVLRIFTVSDSQRTLYFQNPTGILNKQEQEQDFRPDGVAIMVLTLQGCGWLPCPIDAPASISWEEVAASCKWAQNDDLQAGAMHVR